MPDYDIAIIGGGIVGLATAVKLLERTPEVRVCVLEKEERIAQHQTGHNSGVIHSGIYYPPGSQKALNCRRGYDLLLDLCREHGIQYEICGKVIVAVDEAERPHLEALYERGVENGLRGLRRISPAELSEIEPHAKSVSAIHVPQTGIIRFSQVVDVLAGIIRHRGSDIRCGVRVLGLHSATDRTTVETTDGDYQARMVVSCAGLQSDRVARMSKKELDVRIIPFRGEYYKLKPDCRHLVRHMIYPVPNPDFPFLGVHLTRTISGEVKAGPNAVLAMKREGYHKGDFNLTDSLSSLAWPGFLRVTKAYWRTGFKELLRATSKTAFVRAVQRLVPEIEEDDLEAAPAGVRAQACHRSSGLVDDFYFVHGERTLHVCNAPSPAATASLAIGEMIANKVNDLVH